MSITVTVLMRIPEARIIRLHCLLRLPSTDQILEIVSEGILYISLPNHLGNLGTSILLLLHKHISNLISGQLTEGLKEISPQRPLWRTRNFRNNKPKLIRKQRSEKLDEWGFPEYTDEQWAEHRKFEEGYVEMNRERKVTAENEKKMRDERKLLEKRNNQASQPSWQTQQNSYSQPSAPSNQFNLGGQIGSSFNRGGGAGSNSRGNFQQSSPPAPPSWQSQQNAYSPPSASSQFDLGQIGSSFNRGGGAASNSRDNFQQGSPPSPPPWQSQQNAYSSPYALNQLDLGSVGSSFKRGGTPSQPPSPPTRNFENNSPKRPAPPQEKLDEWGFPEYTDEQWAAHKKFEEGYVDINKERKAVHEKKMAEEQKIKEERRKQEALFQAQQSKRREEEARRLAEQRGLGGQRRQPEPPQAGKQEAQEAEYPRKLVKPAELETGKQNSQLQKDQHDTKPHHHQQHHHHKFTQAEALAAEKENDDDEPKNSDAPFYKRWWRKIAGSANLNSAPSRTVLIFVSVITVLVSLW